MHRRKLAGWITFSSAVRNSVILWGFLHIPFSHSEIDMCSPAQLWNVRNFTHFVHAFAGSWCELITFACCVNAFRSFCVSLRVWRMWFVRPQTTSADTVWHCSTVSFRLHNADENFDIFYDARRHTISELKFAYKYIDSDVWWGHQCRQQPNNIGNEAA